MKKGFTLIELLLSIAIVSILSGVLTTVINPANQKNRAKDSVAEKNLADYAGAVEAFYSSEGRYPTSTTDPKFENYYVSTLPNGKPEGATYTYSSDASGSFYVATVSLVYASDYCFKISDSSSVVQKCTIATCGDITDPACTEF